jgi:diguanylate cyclase (GGDEF)-like protein
MEMWIYGIPTPLALAAIAVIGYVFGRRRRDRESARAESQRDAKRAKNLVRQLEAISKQVRCSLASHHSSVEQFRDRVTELTKQSDGAALRQLSEEAERILKPTRSLSQEIAEAYEAFRQQASMLIKSTEMRIDPLTGLSNRRALDETLKHMFAMRARYNTDFSLAIFDLDHFKEVKDGQGQLYGDLLLQRFAHILQNGLRETDVPARIGDVEFAVVMPETGLGAACFLSERVRRTVEKELSITLSGGLAAAQDGENRHTLLARADSALYSAKSSGRNAVFRHTGRHIEPATPGPSELAASNDAAEDHEGDEPSGEERPSRPGAGAVEMGRGART